jgi:hypothetical protein
LRVVWHPETGETSRKKLPSSGKSDFAGALNFVLVDSGTAGIENILVNAATRFGVRPQLLRAVAQAESNFNPRAVSRAGAQGIMQLMPETARSLGVRDPFNPLENVFAGAAYLRSLLDRFGGDEKLALAAYNAGPGAVRRYGGVPPYAETRAYVDRVLSLSSVEQSAQGEPLRTRPAPPADGVFGRPEIRDAGEDNQALAAWAVKLRYALMEYLLQAVAGEEEGAKK